jgi:hypothetical protein
MMETVGQVSNLQKKMTAIECRLVHSLLAENFGPIPAARTLTYFRAYFIQSVGEALAKKGRQTLSSLVQFTNTPAKVVREALIILTQHHFVTYAEQEDARLGRVVVWYELDVNSTLMVLRYPAILARVESQISPIVIIMILIDHDLGARRRVGVVGMRVFDWHASCATTCG